MMRGQYTAGTDYMNIDCDAKCNGIYVENTRRFRFKNTGITGYVGYGFKTSVAASGPLTKNGEMHIDNVYCTQVPYGETWDGYLVSSQAEADASRGIGFSINTADFFMTNCVAA